MRERASCFPPHSNGKVSASYADGGVMSCNVDAGAYDPSVRRADTSPFEWRGIFHG
jgi:hypothetical protein